MIISGVKTVSRPSHFHCPEGAELGPLSYDGFGEKDGDADEKGEKQVHDNECCAAVLSHHIREAPNIAQANGRARHCHYGRETVAEIASIHKG